MANTGVCSEWVVGVHLAEYCGQWVVEVQVGEHWECAVNGWWGCRRVRSMSAVNGWLGCRW